MEIRMSLRGRSPSSKTRQGQAGAEELAIAALAFVAADPQRLTRFLELTGMAVESIRAAARQPGFLAGVLDHLASEEPMLVAFASEYGVDPVDVVAARDVLAGVHGRPDAL
jgi:Protein of unknown function (DUF3572)